MSNLKNLKNLKRSEWKYEAEKLGVLVLNFLKNLSYGNSELEKVNSIQNYDFMTELHFSGESIDVIEEIKKRTGKDY